MYKEKFVSELSISDVKEYYDELRQKTNGDMIKALYPDAEIFIDIVAQIVYVELKDDESEIRCSLNWWNASYESGIYWCEENKRMVINK